MDGRWQTLPKPIAFVFSAGAGSGAVQVGMLQALHEAGLEPDLIVGSSVGALNGAVIACWGLADGVGSLKAVWPHIRREHIFPGGKLGQARHFFSNRTSIFPNHNLIELGVRTLPTRQFEALPIPFGAVATEVMTYHGALFTRGDLYQALLASTAIPGIFPPVEIRGKLYADGALTAYVPMSAAVQMGAASLVVLDVGEGCQRTTPPRHVAEMVTWALHTALRQRALVEAPAIAQQMPVLYLPSPCSLAKGFLDFSNMAERIEESYQLARAFLAYAPLPEPGIIVGGPHHHTTLDLPTLLEVAEA
jgi:NTE family protein